MSAQPAEQIVVCIRRPGSRWSNCPCPNCRDIERRLDKARNCGLLHSLDQQRAAAWAALSRMLEDGWTRNAIADACDLRAGALDRHIITYRAGKTGRLTQPLCVKLLNPVRRPRIGHVPAIGATRRLQALAWMGWTCDAIAARAGVSRISIQECQRGRRGAISAGHAFAIADTYDRLQHIDGGSTTAATRARRNGWAPPAAWDNPDDLTERPKGLGGPKHAATEHILTEVNHLADQGLDFDAIAEALDREPGSLERLLQRHQQHPLLARLRRRAA